MPKYLQVDEIIEDTILELMHVHGFRLPITMAMVGSNGSVLFTRWVQAGENEAEQEHLAGHFEKDGFLVPINMMATDATGRAKLIVAGESGRPKIVTNKKK